jgi:hypothetical protein
VGAMDLKMMECMTRMQDKILSSQRVSLSIAHPGQTIHTNGLIIDYA